MEINSLFIVVTLGPLQSPKSVFFLVCGMFFLTISDIRCAYPMVFSSANFFEEPVLKFFFFLPGHLLPFL